MLRFPDRVNSAIMSIKQSEHHRRQVLTLSPGGPSTPSVPGGPLSPWVKTNLHYEKFLPLKFRTFDFGCFIFGHFLSLQTNFGQICWTVYWNTAIATPTKHVSDWNKIGQNDSFTTPGFYLRYLRGKNSPPKKYCYHYSICMPPDPPRKLGHLGLLPQTINPI